MDCETAVGGMGEWTDACDRGTDLLVLPRRMQRLRIDLGIPSSQLI